MKKDLIREYRNGLYYRECSACREVKPSFEFSVHKTSPDRLRATCRDCVREYNKQLRERR